MVLVLQLYGEAILMSLALTIPKKITKGEELVVVRRHDYEQLLKNFIEAKDALAKIRQG